MKAYNVPRVRFYERLLNGLQCVVFDAISTVFPFTAVDLRRIAFAEELPNIEFLFQIEQDYELF